MGVNSSLAPSSFIVFWVNSKEMDFRLIKLAIGASRHYAPEFKI